MINLKLCGTTLAALMISVTPALAQDGERDGRRSLVLVEIDDHDSDTTNVLIELRRRTALRVCADDFARSEEVACTISEEEAEDWGFFDDDDDDDDFRDRNRGHGNDPDGFDEDNPGLGHGNDRVRGGGNGNRNDNKGGNRGRGN